MKEQNSRLVGIAAVLSGVAAIITSLPGVINSFNESNKYHNVDKHELSTAFRKGSKYSAWCDPRYSAQNNILPATIITKDWFDSTLFIWEDKSFGDKWSPLERCQEVSRRLQVYLDRYGDFFRYINIGTLNRYPVLCIRSTDLSKEGCNASNLLLTLKPGESIEDILEQIIAFPTDAIRIKRGISGNSEIVFNFQQYLNDAPRRQRKKRLLD